MTTKPTSATRSAEYSIKGYLYQFLKYLDELLLANPATVITIEGAIEDIEVNASAYTKAIQCKYHESSDGFTLGKVYKPILQMLKHHSENQSPTSPINYHLYCHFPNSTDTKKLTAVDLATIISTKNKDLIRIVSALPTYNAEKFLELFTIHFGPAFDVLETKVQSLLIAENLTEEDVKSIFYPQAIQRVAEISTKGQLAERQITKGQLLTYLRTTKRTTLTRWTRELSTKAKILKQLRANFISSLSPNMRKRVFIVDPSDIINFDRDIVLFLQLFVTKYATKALHIYSPVFLFHGSAISAPGIVNRLYDISLKANDGVRGGKFREDDFFLSPLIKVRRGEAPERSHSLSISSVDSIISLPTYCVDDVFLVNVPCVPWPISDVAVYHAEIVSLSELEYLLNLRKNYD